MDIKGIIFIFLKPKTEISRFIFLKPDDVDFLNVQIIKQSSIKLAGTI